MAFGSGWYVQPQLQSSFSVLLYFDHVYSHIVPFNHPIVAEKMAYAVIVTCEAPANHASSFPSNSSTQPIQQTSKYHHLSHQSHNTNTSQFT